jgi:hypothetical protein
MQTKPASATAGMTFDMLTFHAYFTAGGQRNKVTTMRRNALKREDERLFKALLNYINAPDGDDMVSKVRRAKVTAEYVAAFQAMKQRQAEQKAAENGGLRAAS